MEWCKTIGDYLELYKNKSKLKNILFDNVVNDYDYEKETGVYFLMKNNNVVYVGKSERCINNRVIKHKKNKDFDDVYFISITPCFANIDIAEYVYINVFNPKYNVIDKKYEYKEHLTDFLKLN